MQIQKLLFWSWGGFRTGTGIGVGTRSTGNHFLESTAISPNAFQSLKWSMLETNGGGTNQTNYTPEALSGAKHLHWAQGCNARKRKTQFLKGGARMLWQARQCKPHVWWHRWENLQGTAISLSPKSQDLAQSLESRGPRINDPKSRLCPGWWQKPQTTSLFTKEPEGDTQFICLLLLSCSHAGSITSVCAVKYTPTHSQNVCAAEQTGSVTF